MTIREQLVETYPDETFLFADGFDDAIIGIDSKFIVCYDQDKCIEILTKDCESKEDASEYFWYNVEGAHMGEKTPRFIKSFTSSTERPTIYESPDGGKTVYGRRRGDYSSRTEIDTGLEFGEGEGHD